MSKGLLDKYYQENTERVQKKLLNNIKIFLKKKKSNNVIVIVTKIFQQVKNKSLLSIEKKYYRMGKSPLL